jgi:nucleotide-binding universal stress UspA family protein
VGWFGHRKPAGPARVPRLLLVADDASLAMGDVEAVASLLARRMKSAVHVVVVGPRALFGPAAEDEILFGGATRMPDTAAKAIQSRFAREGVQATVHVKRGPVAQAIAEVERDVAPDVLILGSSGKATLEYPGYSSVLDQVKNNVGASVLVVHGRNLERVAVGIDGSEPSLHAATTASGWATALGVPLVLLLGEGATRPAGLASSEAFNVIGDAGQVLVDWSRDHPRDLIVVGSRGLGNPGLLRMGSTSDRVSWAARSCVLVVRPMRQ